MENNGKKYVNWTIFVFVVTTIIACFTFIGRALADNIRDTQNNRNEITAIRATITSEFVNIKNSLERIEDKVK